MKLSSEDALALIQQHGSQAAAARASGIPRATLRRYAYGLERPRSRVLMQAVGEHGLDDFERRHVPGRNAAEKIREALSRMRPDSWYYESEFGFAARVEPPELVANRQAFRDHIVDVGVNRHIWASSPEFAATLRSKLV